MPPRHAAWRKAQIVVRRKLTDRAEDVGAEQSPLRNAAHVINQRLRVQPSEEIVDAAELITGRGAISPSIGGLESRRERPQKPVCLEPDVSSESLVGALSRQDGLVARLPNGARE